jgi:PKHD-type hydroxylase
MYDKVFYSSGSVPDMDESFRNACIELLKDLPEQEALITGTGAGFINDHIRSNSIYCIGDEKFKELVLHWSNLANSEIGWNFDIRGVENLQLSKYTVGEKYSWHMDLTGAEQTRKLTFNVTLNEDYEGGEFQFSWGAPNKRYKKRVIDEPAMKQAGKIIIFPSYYYHRVTPVTKGVRYSLTGWAYGPPFK